MGVHGDSSYNSPLEDQVKGLRENNARLKDEVAKQGAKISELEKEKKKYKKERDTMKNERDAALEAKAKMEEFKDIIAAVERYRRKKNAMDRVNLAAAANGEAAQ